MLTGETVAGWGRQWRRAGGPPGEVLRWPGVGSEGDAAWVVGPASPHPTIENSWMRLTGSSLTEKPLAPTPRD